MRLLSEGGGKGQVRLSVALAFRQGFGDGHRSCRMVPVHRWSLAIRAAADPPPFLVSLVVGQRAAGFSPGNRCGTFFR